MLKQDKGFGSGLKGISCMKQKKWQNKKVLILPLAALGDLTIYIRIAWNFYTEGAKVTLKSNLLNTAKEKFPWLIIELEDGKEEFKYYSECYDLVIACYEKYYKESLLEYTNVAFVTAKKIKSTSLAYQRSVMVDDQECQRASRALCLDTSKGLTMVDWADEYTHSVYDIKPKEKQPLIVSESRVKNRILIFPLSPQPKKNYYLKGFIKLADKLEGNLLLIHGTTDDNVHVQNTMEYTRALIEADKHFDMFIFPDKNHFISGGNSRMYLYNKVIDFYKSNL